MSTRLELPLVVDLDGTLIKTDLLYEMVNHFMTRRFFHIIRLMVWLVSGKSFVKMKLAEVTGIDPACLPYNEPLVSWLRSQKSQGRFLVLATASHRLVAESVARYLGLFEEVFATEGNNNLKSQQKRDALVGRFGEHGFDYIGNEAADLTVWKSAKCAYVVSSSSSIIRKARALSNVAEVFSDGRSGQWSSLLRALRPHQWLKNLLIFVPLFVAHRYEDPIKTLQSIVAFIIFSITASSVYLLNDLIDVYDDRYHFRKRYRPFAAGNLNLILHGWFVWPVLLGFAFIVAYLFLPIIFVGVLAAYFIFTLFYSMYLKKIAILDVLVLACLYTIRIIAGSSATMIRPSFWLLSLSMSIFLSLAFVKRFSELKATCLAGKEQKIRGRGYLCQDLELVFGLGTAAGYIAVLVLALYVQDVHTAVLYKTPELIWLACPFLLFWISRIWLVAHRGQMHDDPIIFAVKDRVSWLIGACLIGIFILARLVARN